MDPDDSAVRDASAQVRADFELWKRAIEALPDAQAKVDRASEASEILLKMRGEMADLRIRSVGEIWEQEQLSLAKLGDRFGVSKARADEMIRTYKQQRGTDE